MKTILYSREHGFSSQPSAGDVIEVDAVGARNNAIAAHRLLWPEFALYPINTDGMPSRLADATLYRVVAQHVR